MENKMKMQPIGDRILLKKLKEEKGSVPKNVTNALFVGSTTELQKLIKKNKDKK